MTFARRSPILFPVPPPPDDLVAFLRDRDVFCPLCNYNLRDLLSDRCPECGRELQLTIGLVEPYLRAWIALAVSLFAAAGVGIIFLFLVINQGFPDNEAIGVKLCILYFIACLPIAFAAIVTRRRFLRLERPTQTWLAALAALLTFVGFIVFLTSIR